MPSGSVCGAAPAPLRGAANDERCLAIACAPAIRRLTDTDSAAREATSEPHARLVLDETLDARLVVAELDAHDSDDALPLRLVACAVVGSWLNSGCGQGDHDMRARPVTVSPSACRS